MFGNFELFPDLGVNLSSKQKSVLLLVLACTITFMWASYSLYYIAHLDLYMMIMTIGVLMTLGKDMLDTFQKKHIKPLFIAACIIYVLIPLIIHWEKPSVGVTVQLILFFLVLSLRGQYKLWLYDRFVTVLALLFLASVVEFILAVYMNIGIINSTPIHRFETDAHYFYQGIITMFPSYYQTGLGRFQAFTEEPGVVGTLCAFLIACNDYEHHRWQSTVFIVCGILSMSLAFYLLLSVWLAFRILKTNKNIKNSLILFLVLGIIYIYCKDAINNIIGARIEENATISALDNRNTDSFNRIFEQFVKTKDIIFGRGLRTFHATFDYDGDTYGGNAGVKCFIYSYGIVSLILLFLSYFKCFLQINYTNFKAYLILIMFVLSFYQRDNWSALYYMIPMFCFSFFDNYWSSNSLKE